MEKLIAALMGIVVFALVYLLMAWPLMWSWNYVIPFVFKLPELNYWQAFSLMTVSAFLLKTTNIGSNS